jgi:cytochrome c oxidase subunit 1
MFGRMMSDTLGKIHFWGTTISLNCIFMPLFVLGTAGQHRRIYNFNHYPDLATPDLQNLRVMATVSLLVMICFQFVFLFNFFYSMFYGEKAGPNPWRSNTLEWTTPSPAGHGNWPPDDMPTVYRGPYEYSTPGRDEDYWPQNAPN